MYTGVRQRKTKNVIKVVQKGHHKLLHNQPFSFKLVSTFDISAKESPVKMGVFTNEIHF